ncbi:Type I HSP40 co-chaperone [Coelomomyces lativittatus]|nr:Type I HSP40 co-chaperone [Coelomomyces lativittatus]KAJ1511595.1 Type I HSP40 co-chaperone [Coelomomyces lativittatus]
MIHQYSSACEECSGRGKYYKPKDSCKACEGTGMGEEQTIIEVDVRPGMLNEQHIVFKEQSHQSRGTIPGDFIVILKEQSHPRFKREKENLFIDIEIDLLTALVGGEIRIKHLDDRMLLVTICKGEIINPGAVKVVERQGFPLERFPSEYGNLFIKFDVKFPSPSDLPLPKMTLLESALPPRTPLPSMEGVVVQECVLSTFDPSKTKSSFNARSSMSDDEDESYQRQGNNIQCATQ